jgi:4-amino-4-deoxy-L-arabinose transferase-like glycosyltransferase
VGFRVTSRKLNWASLDGPEINWAWFARRAPRIIAVYIILVLALRLLLSRFMEIDEAQFVGAVNFSLIYSNSHPPLYNWLVRLALELTGWNWVLSLALVRLSLLGLYHWLVFDTARRLSGDRAGVLALAASAFLPQIVWMSIQTTAHTILVIAASIGIVHALALMRSGSGKIAYAWFGIWAAIGALAKYNFFIFLISFLLAAAFTPSIRRQLFSRPFLISIVIFVAAFTPIIIASLNAPLAATAGRMVKLNEPVEYLGIIDLPYIGIDGFVSLLASAVLWAGLAFAVYVIGRTRDHPHPAADGDQDIRKLLLRTILIGMAAFAFLVLTADYHSVAQRYMAPILAPTAILLALYFPQILGARNLLFLSACMFVLAPLGFAGVALFGTPRFTFPYDAVSSAIRAQNPAPATIISNRQDDAANVAVLLHWPPERGSARDIVLVWQDNESPAQGLLAQLPEDALPVSPVTRVTAPVRNFNKELKTFSFQRFSSQSPVPDQNTGG